MSKAYLVIGQYKKTLKPVAVFAKQADAETSANSHKTEENDYWVEEINYYDQFYLMAIAHLCHYYGSGYKGWTV